MPWGSRRLHERFEQSLRASLLELDLEAVVKRPVVVTDAAGNDAIAIRAMTILGLSWDHRALDGATAAQFLAAVRRHLEGFTGA